MGGSVSAGRSNDELVDNLVDAEFIRTPSIQRVFRAVDRGNYYHPNHKQNAYKDIAWKMGNLHLSAPCVYSVVMEALKLKPGLSFLNLGSGSGYLSTMVGLILGRYGVNHGIEFHSDIVDYAYERLDDFLKNSKIVDECDFCEPVFNTGNCLRLESSCQQYDRVYCGAACPEEYENYLKNLVKINGILIMPLNDRLLKITRITETQWNTVKILSVSFAPLIPPPMTKKGEVIEYSKLSDITPPNLQQICRFAIRSTLRQNVDIEHPKLKSKSNPSQCGPRRQVRRIVIPFFDESDLSNSLSDTEYEYDSDGAEYTISSRLPSRMSVFLEDFLRRHAELQILRQMEEEVTSDSDAESRPPRTTRSSASREEGADSRPSRTTRSSARKEENDDESTDKKKLANKATNTPPMPGSSNANVSTHSSDGMESNFDEPPSQSTRSKKKRKKSLKRKRAGSSSGSTQPKKRVLRTAATVVWKKTDSAAKKSQEEEVKGDAEEGTSDMGYTEYMVQKIECLPLPSFLQHFLNYRRYNM